jgi:hypothetical protein
MDHVNLPRYVCRGLYFLKIFLSSVTRDQVDSTFSNHLLTCLANRDILHSLQKSALTSLCADQGINWYTLHAVRHIKAIMSPLHGVVPLPTLAFRGSNCLG